MKYTEGSGRNRTAKGLFVLVTVVIFAFASGLAWGQNQAPKVVTVPVDPTDLTASHPAWPGLNVVLKGTAHDPDGDAQLARFRWAWGDGLGDSGWVTGVNPYIIERSHAYACATTGLRYVAILEVCDTAGLCGQDSYLVQCVDPNYRDEHGWQINKINKAIDEGLWYDHKLLSRYTTSDGAPAAYIPYGSYAPATTAAAIEAFEGRWTYPYPLGNKNENPYVDDVERGINYLLTVLQSIGFGGAQTCPQDLNANSVMLGYPSGDAMYQSPMMLQALATSQVPDAVATTGAVPNVKGRTYADIARDMADYLVYGQSDASTGVYRGGWRYTANYGMSDNSVTQWPILGLESGDFFFDIPVNQCVKDELGRWLGYSQCADGGFSYYPAYGWCNNNKTGAGMAGLALIDRPVSDAQWQAGERFLVGHKDWGGWGDQDWQNLYGLYAVMKAMVLQEHNMCQQTGELYQLNCLQPAGGDKDSCLPGRANVGWNWYQTYSDRIVSQQRSDGAWWGHVWFNEYLATPWAVMVLERSVTCHSPVADAGPRILGAAPGEPVELNGCASRPPAKYNPNAPDFTITRYCWDFDNDGTFGEAVDPVDPLHHPAEPCSDTQCTATFTPPVFFINDDPAQGIDWTRTQHTYPIEVQITTTNKDCCPTQDVAPTSVEVVQPPYGPKANLPADISIGCADCTQIDASASHHPAYPLYCLVDRAHPFCDWITSWTFDLDGDGAYDDGYCEDTAVPPDDQYDWCYWDADQDGTMDHDGRHITWCNGDFNNFEKDQTIVRLKVCDAVPSPDPNVSDCNVDDMVIDAAGAPPLCTGFIDHGSGQPVTVYYCDPAGNWLHGVAERRCPTDSLEYRWDFTCDGTWDTQWSADPSAFTTYVCDVDRNACFQTRVVDAPDMNCITSIPVLPCQPPVAIGAATPATDCDTPGNMSVHLDGSLSIDPQGRNITCEWYEGANLVGVDCLLDVSLPLGEHSLTLKVSNDCTPPRATTFDLPPFTLADAVNPGLDVPPPLTWECAGNQQTCDSVQASSQDACGPTTCTNDWNSGGCNASGCYPLGTTTVQFTSTDPAGNPTIRTTSVTVLDRTLPVISCPASVTVECQASSQSVVALPPAVATDTCYGAATIVNTHTANGADASGSYPLGETIVTFTATDGSGNPASCQTAVTVLDRTNPTVSVSATPNILWPPNHKMTPVGYLVTVADACDTAPGPTVILLSAVSSEPDDVQGGGDGNTTNDIQAANLGAADYELQLRSERQGAGHGRIYTITYQVTDHSGNITLASAEVRVPHDMGDVVEPVNLTLQGAQATLVSWRTVPGAVHYDVVRGDVANLRVDGSNINLGPVVCIENESTDTTTAGHPDTARPQPGGAFFYAVQFYDGVADSSYGSEAVGRARVVQSGNCP